MAQPLCRWGILGTANIARKNWKAIRNAGNATLVAVASRDAARARQFIAECQAAAPHSAVPAACGSYEELIARMGVDAIYFPLPTGIRTEWVVRAAKAGKHILCEKPCGTATSEVRTMLDACRANKVQFMDGVMFMHSQRLALMRQTLDDRQSVGDILRITSQFSFKGSDEFLKQNIRVSGELEPLGCLGDLGWYNIRFSLWAMNERLPERVSGRILAEHGRGDSGQPVPIDFSGELFFPGNVSAAFYCSFRAQNQQWATVSGTQGYLHVRDFVIPFIGSEVAFEVNTPVFRIDGCDFQMEDHARRLAVHEYSAGTANAQESNMFRTFSRIVLTRQLEPQWGDKALRTQQVLDACLRSARAGGEPMTVAAPGYYRSSGRFFRGQVFVEPRQGGGRNRLHLLVAEAVAGSFNYQQFTRHLRLFQRRDHILAVFDRNQFILIAVDQ
jgi:predicted dehydrogenase